MEPDHYGLGTIYIDGETIYHGDEISFLHQVVNSQLNGALQAHGAGVMLLPDDTSLKVTAATGLNASVAIGKAIVLHSQYGGVYLNQGAVATVPVGASATSYVFAAVEVSDTNDSRKTAYAAIVVTGSPTLNGGTLLAQVTTNATGVTGVIDRRMLLTQLRIKGDYNAGTIYYAQNLVTSGGGLWVALRQSVGVTPVEGADWHLVIQGGNIGDASTTVKGITKLSTAPAVATNPIAVGDNDPRNTNARTPIAHASTHASGGSDPIAIAAAQVTSGQFAVARLGSGTPDGTKYLRDDGTFATPSGGGMVSDASTTVKGVSTLSVAPASPTAPIAVGDNDPRNTNARTPNGAAGGDLSGTYPNPTLANSGVAAGTYGSATQVPVTTYDAKGRATGVTLATISGGGGSNPTRTVAQNAHGFTVGKFLRVTGNDTYALASNDTPANADVVGIVTAVADANNFTLAPAGNFANVFSGLDTTLTYFLGTAGNYTTVEPLPPTGVNKVRRIVMQPINATTALLISDIGIIVQASDPALKVGASDIEITDATKGIILKSPNGSRFRATINNSGAWVITPL